MAVRIQLAATTAEIDGVLRARHRVYAGDGYVPAQSDERITDRFDAFPTSANFAVVALEGPDRGSVVGSIRALEDDPAVGLPADEYYDFTGLLPDGARVGSLSMLCLDRAYRGQRRIFVGLLGMGTYWCVRRGLTHLRAAVNPEIEPHVRRMGFVTVAPPFRHESGVDVVPMVLEIARLSDVFLDYVRRQHLESLLDGFDRHLYQAGEILFRAGDRGDHAFVITDGRVGIDWGQAGVDRVLQRGDLFGELALLTDRPRSATAVALEDVEVMALSREVFRDRIGRDPDLARALLALVAGRLADVLVPAAPAPG